MPEPSKGRLKIGMLGAGAAAQWYYLPATQHWNDRLQLTAVCDVDEARAGQFADQYGGTAYGDYEAMLGDPEVDAVAVLTPHRFHTEQVIAALQAGKHVLVEKPGCNNLSEFEALCDLAEKRGLQLMLAMAT